MSNPGSANLRRAEALAEAERKQKEEDRKQCAAPTVSDDSRVSTLQFACGHTDAIAPSAVRVSVRASESKRRESERRSRIRYEGNQIMKMKADQKAMEESMREDWHRKWDTQSTKPPPELDQPPASSHQRCPPACHRSELLQWDSQAARRDAEAELKAARHAQKHHEIRLAQKQEIMEWERAQSTEKEERRQFRKEFEQKMKAEAEEERIEWEVGAPAAITES